MSIGNKNILFITKDKIKAFKVKDETSTELLTEYTWDEESLDLILSKTKTVLGTNIRVLLDEDLCFVFGFSVAQNLQIGRQEIQEKAQAYIPEDLSETRWDFKEILDGEKRYIQVIAIVKSFFDRLNTAAVKARLNIEAVEPSSYSLARLVKDEKKSLIMAYLLEESSFLAVVDKGVVYLSKKITVDKITEEIIQMNDFAVSKFQIDPKKIIINNVGNIDQKLLEANNFKIEVKNLNIYLGLAIKEDLKGKDEDSLNLEPVAKRGEEKKEKGPVSFFVGVLIGLIILGLGFWFWSKSNKGINRSTKSEEKLILTKTQATPTATQEIGRSEYKIQILNGSGEEGAASELKTALEKVKFTVSGTDNADNYDYETTEVRYKKKIDEAFKVDLNKELGKTYSITKGKELANDSDYDVIIIIGKK